MPIACLHKTTGEHFGGRFSTLWEFLKATMPLPEILTVAGILAEGMRYFHARHVFNSIRSIGRPLHFLLCHIYLSRATHDPTHLITSAANEVGRSCARTYIYIQSSAFQPFLDLSPSPNDLPGYSRHISCHHSGDTRIRA